MGTARSDIAGTRLVCARRAWVAGHAVSGKEGGGVKGRRHACAAALAIRADFSLLAALVQLTRGRSVHLGVPEKGVRQQPRLVA